MALIIVIGRKRLSDLQVSDDETNPAFDNSCPLEAKQVIGKSSKC